MKAEEYAAWRAVSPGERIRAAMDLSMALYASKIVAGRAQVLADVAALRESTERDIERNDRKREQDRGMEDDYSL